MQGYTNVRMGRTNSTGTRSSQHSAWPAKQPQSDPEQILGISSPTSLSDTCKGSAYIPPLTVNVLFLFYLHLAGINILSTNLANKPRLLEKYGKRVEMEMCVPLTNSKKESSDTQQ